MEFHMIAVIEFPNKFIWKQWSRVQICLEQLLKGALPQLTHTPLNCSKPYREKLRFPQKDFISKKNISWTCTDDLTKFRIYRLGLNGKMLRAWISQVNVYFAISVWRESQNRVLGML